MLWPLGGRRKSFVHVDRLLAAGRYLVSVAAQASPALLRGHRAAVLRCRALRVSPSPAGPVPSAKGGLGARVPQTFGRQYRNGQIPRIP